MVEWAARLPQSLKISGGEAKLVLTRAMEPLLPHDVLYRPKMGFAVPLAQWFRGPLRARAKTLLVDEPDLAGDLFQADRLRRLHDEHAAGQRDWSAPIWALTCFSLGRYGQLARQEETA